MGKGNEKWNSEYPKQIHGTHLVSITTVSSEKRYVGQGNSKETQSEDDGTFLLFRPFLSSLV